jgi:antitoxin HicB
MKSKYDHSGSTFDSFLEEEGIREEVEATAIKRVIAWEIEQAMQSQHKSKMALARELHTSRTQLDRLLDPGNTSVSLQTIARAASALGKRMVVTFSDKRPRRREKTAKA